MKLYELLAAVRFRPKPFIEENIGQRLTQEEAKNKKVICIIAINDEIYIEVDED